MIKIPSTDRLFSLSCFEGLRLIRQYGQRYPQYKLEELLDIVLQVEADAMSLDMEAAVKLHKIVTTDCPLDGELFYQECIKAVVVSHQPIWAKSMKGGRMRFIYSLVKNSKYNSDDLDVFRAAGLLFNPPGEQIVAWWDDISGHARLTIDTKKLVQARKAERLTIEHETRRIESLGIERMPEWPGLDDNFAGYDILSFDLRDGEEINIMIEVKSTGVSPPRFFLSRNEWDKANQVGDVYKFHVWNMVPARPQLFELSVEAIRPHIPSNNEEGKWTNVEIPLRL